MKSCNKGKVGMAKDDKAPVDHAAFERVAEAMRDLSNVINEVDQAIAVARGIDRHEAQRALNIARARIEEASFWVNRAIKFAMGKSSTSVGGDI